MRIPVTMPTAMSVVLIVVLTVTLLVKTKEDIGLIRAKLGRHRRVTSAISVGLINYQLA